ncbi:hypothetical protein B7P43_G01867 [Cryptotermes secundus]|uniref:Integrase catalytic domain-containing protein n=1 Tax=Cryptotermes secundus TaxID=105785 RepID=A0A2J7QWJ2_9NEOP|nr:hypothetical protein B7P43_G01867 [Cryptotermes secundus]
MGFCLSAYCIATVLHDTICREFLEWLSKCDFSRRSQLHGVSELEGHVLQSAIKWDTLRDGPCQEECTHYHKLEARAGIEQVRAIVDAEAAGWDPELKDQDMGPILEEAEMGQCPDWKYIADLNPAYKSYCAQLQSRPPNQDSGPDALVQFRGLIRDDSHQCSRVLHTERPGNRHLLIAIHCFTKWQEAYAIFKQEASPVAQALVTDFCCFGVPQELQRDQDRNSESRLIQKFLQRLGVRKTRITPLHLQSDGTVERYNKTAEEHLRKFVASYQTDWDARLLIFLLIHRTSTHDTTGLTPASLEFGREFRLPCDLLFGAHPNKE